MPSAANEGSKPVAEPRLFSASQRWMAVRGPRGEPRRQATGRRTASSAASWAASPPAPARVARRRRGTRGRGRRPGAAPIRSSADRRPSSPHTWVVHPQAGTACSGTSGAPTRCGSGGRARSQRGRWVRGWRRSGRRGGSPSGPPRCAGRRRGARAQRLRSSMRGPPRERRTGRSLVHHARRWLSTGCQRLVTEGEPPTSVTLVEMAVLGRVEVTGGTGVALPGTHGPAPGGGLVAR